MDLLNTAAAQALAAGGRSVDISMSTPSTSLSGKMAKL